MISTLEVLLTPDDYYVLIRGYQNDTDCALDNNKFCSSLRSYP